ncbi:MAG TPA: phosphatidate cytidylyltransferase [Terriglobales bacterium]
MKRVLTALVLIPLVLLAVFLAPNWLFTALIGLVALLATIEYMPLAAGYGYEPFRFLTYLLLITLFVILAIMNSAQDLLLVVFFFALAPFAYLCVAMNRKDMRSALPGAALSYIALPYIGFSLWCLDFIREVSSAGWLLLLFTFAVIWVGDTAAYYVGRSFGKTKFAPSISPKKTWEGAIASGLGAIVIGIVLVAFGSQISVGLARIHLLRSPVEFLPTPLWITSLVALAINIAGQIGDLLESLIKRGAGVKDSGSLLPGHGGILDRIDALLFAAPVALVLFIATGNHFLRLP